MGRSGFAMPFGKKVPTNDAALAGIVHERWHPYRKFGKAKGLLDLSEAPQAYKDIEDVIRSELDLVEPLVRLLPLASLKG